MRIHVKCSQNEYAQALFLHYNTQTLTKFLPSLFVLSIVLWCLSLVYNEPFSESLGIGLFVFTVGLCLVRKFMLPQMIYNRNKSLQSEYLWDFSEEGVYVKSDCMEAQFDWAKFTSVVRGSKYYLLYIGKDQFSVIPKRGFETSEELATFDRLLKDKSLL